ncbi:hypothetical protein ERO13_A06G129902v2 [Gossypium hirsutum]|nr:hypothetical protein ERO13_A06G129902v2 [Gossypium hirsutum]
MVINAKLIFAQVKGIIRVALKKRQEKKYHFLDGNIPNMLKELLKAKLVRLLELKRPEEANRVDYPNYCKYHWLISHPSRSVFC